MSNALMASCRCFSLPSTRNLSLEPNASPSAVCPLSRFLASSSLESLVSECRGDRQLRLMLTGPETEIHRENRVQRYYGETNEVAKAMTT